MSGEARNSKTPFSIEDWSSQEALPQAQWEKLLREKVGRCHLMIVLVGRSMGTATGVAKEIGFARDQNVPFFGVYVDGADASSTLPAGLPGNRTITWDWDNIAAAVKQMMGEGRTGRTEASTCVAR
ncbi:MAG: hypothetical protein IPL90_09345 [Holophagales bacterium]|nr:hypothetical protein [Holophagales bacterium]